MKKLLSLITFLALFMTAQLGMAADFPESKLNFELGKTELPADAGDAVAKVAEYLKATPDAKVQVSGYTDTSGDAAQNAELAKNRAAAVTTALTAAGVPADSIVMKKPEEIEKVGSPEAARVVVLSLAVVAPAAGFVGPMGSIVLGLIAGVAGVWGVSSLKILGADDAFDVFGVHGVCGIVGAVLTAVFAAPGLGGTGGLTPDTFNMASQVWIQIKSVLITIGWSAVVAFIAYKIADVAIGLRVSEEAEREGLDITSHGETAYHR